MRIEPAGELDALLKQIDLQHVVLEFTFYQSDPIPTYNSHLSAAHNFLILIIKNFNNITPQPTLGSIRSLRIMYTSGMLTNLSGHESLLQNSEEPMRRKRRRLVTGPGPSQTWTVSKRRSSFRHTDCRSQLNEVCCYLND